MYIKKFIKKLFCKKKKDAQKSLPQLYFKTL